MNKISIVIPCYNEELIIKTLYKRLTKTANKWSLDWEVICVDDGSKDKTFHLLSDIHNKDPRWKAVSLSRNFGHQAAISCGMHHATGDAVVVIDADLQDPPEFIATMIQHWKKGYEVVYAVRKKRKESNWKKISYWMFYRLLSKLSTFEIPLDSGDFSLIDKKVLQVLKQMPERNRFIRGLRAWTGFKQIGIEYERHARHAGETKYPFKKLVGLALDGIFSFSYMPLTLASYFGFFVAIIALLGIVFTFLQRIFSSFFVSIGIGPVPGFATIVIAILFLGGVQLIFLGILGNYISRIYDEVKARPQWIINNRVGF